MGKEIQYKNYQSFFAVVYISLATVGGLVHRQCISIVDCLLHVQHIYTIFHVRHSFPLCVCVGGGTGGADLPQSGGGRGEESSQDSAEVLQIFRVHRPLQSLLRTHTHTQSKKWISNNM